MPPNPYRRQPNINDMMYPKGSKQPRQVWGAVMNVYKAPQTTPQPTPTPTGTANPTPTPSVTQTQTGTPNITPSPTQTRSGTPLPTSTQTPTPTQAAGTSQAQTYLSAVVAAGGTVTAPMSAATITMFNSIWSNGLNNGMIYMYPFIGGTSAAHRIQALSPGTYNLTFNGGWTHNASGSTSNGTNAYANTFYTPNTTSSLNLSGGTLGFYCGTNNTGGCAMGVLSGNNDGWTLYPQTAANKMSGSIWENTTFATTTASIANSLGMMLITRSGSTSTVQFYRRGTLVESVSETANAIPPYPIFLGALNQNETDTQYSAYRHQFDFAHTGMTSSQISTFNTIIQTYQTSLGRNVY